MFKFETLKEHEKDTIYRTRRLEINGIISMELFKLETESCILIITKGACYVRFKTNHIEENPELKVVFTM